MVLDQELLKSATQLVVEEGVVVVQVEYMK